MQSETISTMQVGIVLDAAINKEERESAIDLINKFNFGRDFREFLGHHGDKIKTLITEVDADRVSELVCKFSKYSCFHGAFEAVDFENPLDAFTRIDLYGRDGTFFGNDTGIKIDPDNGAPYSDIDLDI